MHELKQTGTADVAASRTAISVAQLQIAGTKIVIELIAFGGADQDARDRVFQVLTSVRHWRREGRDLAQAVEETGRPSTRNRPVKLS